MKYKNLFFFFIIETVIICNGKKKEGRNLIDWGKNNDIEFSPSIEISKNEQGIKKFVAIRDIEINIELLKIPYNIILNIEKALELINSTEIKSQFEKFQKLNITTYNTNQTNLQKEEIFLSYILYIIRHESGIYNKTKFYKQYKPYISSLKDYSPKSPFFYTSEQIEYLSGTYLGTLYNKNKKNFEDEIKIFKDKSYYNKDINYKDYVHNRLLTHNKGLKIKTHICLVPFLNYFDGDYLKNNAKIKIENNGDVKIITKKPIKKGNTIIVNSPKKPNIERMLFEGELNHYIVNYKEKYIIPIFSPGLYYKYDIDDTNLYNTHFMDLSSRDFEGKAIGLYKKYTKEFKGDSGDAWVYGILLENINFYLQYIKSFKSKYINIFENKELIEKSINSEERILERTADNIKRVYDFFINKEIRKQQINSDL